MNPRGYAYSVIGSRELNQDAYLIENERGLYAIADGVGGGVKGEVASGMAVSLFKDLAPKEGSLTPTIERLQEEVFEESIRLLGEPLMGTTFTGLRIVGDRATLCHVGDSRCYLFSGGRLKQLTVDHEAFEESFQSPVLASYLGIPEDLYPLQVQEEVVQIAPTDLLLLCTDGLYRQVLEPEMVSLINRVHQKSVEDIPEQLCRVAETDPFSDNITVILIYFP